MVGNTKVYALIFAGGVGRRMHTNGVPKQFLKIYSKPIIIYTLEHFQNHRMVDNIIVVCIENYINQLKDLLKKYDITKVTKIVCGGKTSQDSIYEGLNALNQIGANKSDIVMIHDGVRPVITEALITENIKATKKYGNAISAAVAIETIGHKGVENNTIDEIFSRSSCLIAKAPQTFVFGDIYDAHMKAKENHNENVIDSATLMLSYGYKLHYVECATSNIKVTNPIDYYILKGILKAQESMQIIGV